MTETEKEDQAEAKLEAGQIMQLREGMIAAGMPKAFVDSIPPEKLTDPEFLKRAVAMAQGLPIPTSGPMKDDKIVESPAFELPGMDEIMKMAGPLLEGFQKEMEKSGAELARMKAGLKTMFDQITHVQNELHAMNDGCLLAPKKK